MSNNDEALKDISHMTQKEIDEYLSDIDPNIMGADGREGMEMSEDVCP